MHQDYEKLDSSIGLLLKTNAPRQYLDLFHQLLLMPEHTYHQQVARVLQQIGDPDTIPYVKKVFEQGFDYLDYTCSDSCVIAK